MDLSDVIGQADRSHKYNIRSIMGRSRCQNEQIFRQYNISFAQQPKHEIPSSRSDVSRIWSRNYLLISLVVWPQRNLIYSPMSSVTYIYSYATFRYSPKIVLLHHFLCLYFYLFLFRYGKMELDPRFLFFLPNS